MLNYYVHATEKGKEKLKLDKRAKPKNITPKIDVVSYLYMSPAERFVVFALCGLGSPAKLISKDNTIQCNTYH